MVFLSPQERAGLPLSERLDTLLIAVPMMIALMMSVVSARLTVLALPATFLTIAVLAWRRQDLRFMPRPSWLLLTSLGFVLLAFLSALWARYPEPALEAGARIAAAVYMVMLGSQLAATARRDQIVHMAEGIWLGLLIAFTYFAIEVGSHQAIKIFVYNTLGLGPQDLEPANMFRWHKGKLVRIVEADNTRNTTSLTMHLWPAILAALAVAAKRWRAVVAAALFGIASFAIVMSTHETSKIALLCGTIVFAIAWASPLWARRLVATVWIAGTIAAVPIAIALHDTGVSELRWLQKSAAKRFEIWGATARRTLDAPILGIGARMSYHVSADVRSTAGNAIDQNESLGARVSHPHNVYLQVWYELGAVGAVIFTLIGVLLVRGTRLLPGPTQPFALATFSSAAVLIASSYGLWQIWFLALLALAALLLAISVRAYATRPESAPSVTLQ